MKNHTFLTIIFVLLFSEFLYAEQPPQERWGIRYNGPENSDDFSSGIAIDNLGNVYVTGRSDDSSAVPDYATIKYDSNGTQKWAARYNGPANNYDGAHAIAVDNAGNVYVTGESWGGGTGYDYATIKYDSNGIQKWLARYNNGLENADDYAQAIVIDNADNIYVTGGSIGSGTFEDYVTIKYDSNGIQKWVARYDGTGNNFDCAYAIALDNSGNIYVTGSSWGGDTSYDYATIKYDANGTQKWAARYNAPGNSEDHARAIAVDNADNVYITGESYGSGTISDYATIKYDSNGTQKWAARYNGPGNNEDNAQAIAVDNTSNVYVTGSSWGSGTSNDFATIKYDQNGTQKWAARYNGPENYDDSADDIALDSAGNVYVTGGSFGSTNNDYVTIKYDPNGNQIWAERYDGPVSSDDYAQAIAADNQGNVYVTGCSTDTGSDYMTIKYTQHNYCTGIAGDLNGNCKVDFADYAILAGDRHIASTWDDLAALADNWLKCGYALQEDCW
jgi:uncharacterized delta-60 repeat protein